MINQRGVQIKKLRMSHETLLSLIEYLGEMLYS